MAQDWAADVKKFVPDADDGVIAGIVRYCGIALQKVDSSLVSFSDPTELARVRNNFLKKKLALTQPDDELDAAIAKVGERMKGDRTKNRVTVYYLLLEHFGLLHRFAKAGTPAATAPDGTAALGLAAVAGAAAASTPKTARPQKAPDGTAGLGLVAETPKTSKPKPVAAKPHAAPDGTAGLGLVAGAGAIATGVGTSLAAGASETAAAVKGVASDVGATASAAVDSVKTTIADVAAPVVAAAAPVAAPGFTAGTPAPLGMMGGGYVDDRTRGPGWIGWVLLALAALVVLWWLFTRPAHVAPVAAPAATTEAVAPAVADDNLTAPNATATVETAAIPAGAGVVSETRDGKPVVKVFFDTGKAVVVPAFTPAAGALKTYLDAHAGSTLGVSGFNDPTGNAAANAALSKRRAEAVKAALVAAAIPDASIALVKPEAATDTAATDNSQARRVEVYIK